LGAKRAKYSARLIGTQINGGEILRQELDGMPVVCFDCGYGKIELSDQL
jgi:hypothetical protein